VILWKFPRCEVVYDRLFADVMNSVKVGIKFCKHVNVGPKEHHAGRAHSTHRTFPLLGCIHKV
jgi:hypothetical protein